MSFLLTSNSTSSRTIENSGWDTRTIREVNVPTENIQSLNNDT